MLPFHGLTWGLPCGLPVGAAGGLLLFFRRHTENDLMRFGLKFWFFCLVFSDLGFGI